MILPAQKKSSYPFTNMGIKIIEIRHLFLAILLLSPMGTAVPSLYREYPSLLASL